MTTIIVKNADFSSGAIAHYNPPVEGASLLAFVGDESDGFIRNYGDSGDLVPTGDLAVLSPGFRTFNSNSWLQSSAYRATNTTMLAVYKSITPISNWGASFISCLRPHADGGRRGIDLLRTNNIPDDICRAQVDFTTAGAANTFSMTLSAKPAGAPAFVAGVVEQRTTGSGIGAWVTTHRLTPSAEKTALGSVVDNATAEAQADEADYPFRIGTDYRSPAFVTQSIGIGFVAAYPFKLTDAEIAAMYASVKRRFTSLGVTI